MLVHPRLVSIGDDRKALGGFFESILAVMIVTSGFTLLLVSVNLVQGDEGRVVSDDVQEQVRSICLRLLGDERIFLPPYILLLSNSFLWDGIVQDAMSAFTNYSVTLFVDLEHPRSILLARGGLDANSGEIINVRIPVDVQMTPSTVHVGILEVKVVA
jgi:hypothetical protein